MLGDVQVEEPLCFRGSILGALGSVPKKHNSSWGSPTACARKSFATVTYSIVGITPGNYQLFSSDSIENGAHYDPDFLKQYEQPLRGVHVTVVNQRVDLRLIPAP